MERRQHVISRHLKCGTVNEIKETLSSEIRRCFPGCLVYSDEQVQQDLFSRLREFVWLQENCALKCCRQKVTEKLGMKGISRT